MFLRKELVSVRETYSSRDEALTAMANRFVTLGICKETFPDAIIERESKYPTGLPTVVGTAIAHCDAGHVNEPAMGVMTLANPVEFEQMGGGDPLDVSIVFMLAVVDPKEQVPLLQKVMGVMQDGDLLLAMHEAESSEALWELLAPRFAE